MPNEPVDNKGTTGAKLELVPSPVELKAKALATKLINASDLEVEDPRFIWDGFLEAEALGMLIGDSGIGKGMMTAWIFSQLTKGELQGEYFGKPMKTLFISAEERYNRVTVPRLKAQDADLSMIKFLDPLRDFKDLILNDEGIQVMCRMMQDEGICLVHIDPIIDFFPEDKAKDSETNVRAVLAPLGLAAMEYGVTVVGIRHTRKGNSNMEDSILGSKAWRAVARSAVGLYKHPDPEEFSLRVAVNMKMNNAAEEEKGRVYKIQGVDVPGLDKPVGRLVWTGESYAKSEIEELDGRGSRERQAISNEKNDQEQIVRKYFAENGGEVSSKKAIADLQERLGKSRATVFRITNRIEGLDKGKQGDVNSVWKLSVDSKNDEGYAPLHAF